LTCCSALSASAHVSLDAPNGGEHFSAGEIVTIQWHIYIAHTLQNWDLWYAVDDSVDYTPCADQPGFTWNLIEMDYPMTCTNAGGGCGTPGGCTMQYQWTVPDGINSNHVKIRVRMDNSGTDYYDVSDAPFTVTSSSSVGALLPERGLALWQNYPNPARGATTIPFALAGSFDAVRLSIFDASGALVRTLVQGPGEAGTRFVRWDRTDQVGHRVAGGAYFYVLSADRQRMTKRLILID